MKTSDTSSNANDMANDIEAQNSLTHTSLSREDDATTSTDDSTNHELHETTNQGKPREKYSAYLRHRFLVEKELFLRSWKVVVFAAFFQYVHSVATNLVYYLHEPADEAIKDLGFELLPPLAEEDQYISEVVFFLLVAIIVGFAVQPFFFQSASERYVTVMVTRYARVLVLAQTLRIISFLGTVLPSPNYHCEADSESYNPPQNAGEIFLRIDALTGCGDLIFSSHTIFVTLGGLSIHQYSKSKPLKVLTWSLVVTLGFLVVAARKHYTVDVVVAWYTCPLLWFYVAKTYPDDQPRKQRQSQDHDVATVTTVPEAEQHA